MPCLLARSEAAATVRPHALMLRPPLANRPELFQTETGETVFEPATARPPTGLPERTMSQPHRCRLGRPRDRYLRTLRTLRPVPKVVPRGALSGAQVSCQFSLDARERFHLTPDLRRV